MVCFLIVLLNYGNVLCCGLSFEGNKPTQGTQPHENLSRIKSKLEVNFDVPCGFYEKLNIITHYVINIGLMYPKYMMIPQACVMMTW